MWEMRNAYKILVRKVGGQHLGFIGMDERVILKNGPYKIVCKNVDRIHIA
jgi:hypothetical protein